MDKIIEGAKEPGYDFNIYIVPDMDGVVGIALYDGNDAVIRATEDVYDIQRVIAHELGHLLGRREHNDRSGTVMHKGATGNEIDRVDWQMVNP